MRPVAITLFALLAVQSLSAEAAGLTIRTGESFVFAISRGQPVRVRKVNPSAKPGPGQVLVSVRAMMGTTMSISSNDAAAYTYKAELLGSGKVVPIRSCTLPANGRVAFEHWPQQAEAVRLSDFKLAPAGGSCP